MCGVHNCTKNVDVRDLQSFAMIGIAAGRQHVTINMPIPAEIPHGPQNLTNRTYIFANVSNMRIENVTVYFISLSFHGKNCCFEAKHANFYGYTGSMTPLISVVNITYSQAILKDCTFQHNCFVRIQSYAVLSVSDCTFFSYNHAVYSAIAVDNSTIKISGTVSFINNTVGNDQHRRVCGAAISLNSNNSLYKVPMSIFNITEGNVSFINNTAMYCGGAIYLKSTIMTVSSNTTMNFTGNQVVNNFYVYGGGGAMQIEQSRLSVKNAVINFINNSAHGAAYGGAVFQLSDSSIDIREHDRLNFVGNVAQIQGGAVYHLSWNAISVDEYSSLVFHNNSADQGGACYLQPNAGNITVGKNSHIEFSYNSARKYGGAIYVDDQDCIFDFKSNSSTVLFRNNSAMGGVGMHIYGASVKQSNCMATFCYSNKNIVQYIPNITNSFSPVSSSPKRVCLCDTDGKPQCANSSSIYVNHYKVYRGEIFNISVVVVGYDFGATIGTVVADFMPSIGHYTQSLRLSQYHQWIGSSRHCTDVSYTIYSNNTHEKLYLHSSEKAIMYIDKTDMLDAIRIYNYSKHGCISGRLIATPVFINITLLDGCPPGFILTFQRQLYGCHCYSVLQNNHFDCFITNNAAYLRWNNTMWVNATFNKYNESESNGILLAHYCPLSYCISGEKITNLGTNPNTQCDFNHAGVLCGGCKNNYSLAIGSSHCIRCYSDMPLLFLTLFAIVGILLVLFILLLNLTVTQGLINGLVFYANILWTYKGVLFPPEQQQATLAFQFFIAWLNLDFGIETCFVVGLTAFWKTWLQFLFPLYIWFIAGVIIIACRYSSRLTNLIGDRAVPLLATLFLLSYTKLLRTVMTIFEFGVLTHYPDESKIIVWRLDGNLPYCQQPHIYLFLIAVPFFLFLCLPFTLFLLLIQCWRRISHLKLLRWINKLTPFYDAYFAPLEDKHHYWFGTLLLIRGALLIVFTATSSISPFVSLLILAIILAMLLFYMSIKPVYKSKLVRLFESASVINLLVLMSCTLYTGDRSRYYGTTALQLSIGFAFVQFLLIILISAIKTCYHNINNIMCRQRRGYSLIDEDSRSNDDMFHERINEPDINVIFYPVRDTMDKY